MRSAIAALTCLSLMGCSKPANDAWQGYMEGEFVLLASPYAGQLQKLSVKRGERIDAGKPVFVLEQENERAARLEAEQRVKTAVARLENLQGRTGPRSSRQRRRRRRRRAHRVSYRRPSSRKPRNYSRAASSRRLAWMKHAPRMRET
jgi:HlyD family secretion protein